MSAPPPVLLCTFDVVPRPSGLTRRLSAYVRALAEKYDVTLVSLKSGEQSHIERLHGARHLRVPVGAGDLPSRVQAFERAIQRQLASEQYALVHFTDPFAGYGACESRGEAGYRVIYDAQGFPSQELAFFHGENEADRKFLAKVRRQELFCLMNADRVVTGSAPTQAFVRALGVGREAVKVIRAPAPVEALGDLPPPGHAPMRALYLGNLAPYQGVPTLLRALAEAAGVQLTIAGPKHPDWDGQLKELARELGVEDRLERVEAPNAARIKELLAEADVGLVPLEDCERNRLQGGPVAKASDYLAAGRAVIASDLPVTRDVLPSDATMFVPPGDPVALAEALRNLARDPQKRIALGHEARAFAEAYLDENAIGRAITTLYAELLQPKREARPKKPAKSALGPRDETRIRSIPSQVREAPKTEAKEVPRVRTWAPETTLGGPTRPTIDLPATQVEAPPELAWVEKKSEPKQAPPAETTVEPWSISEPARADGKTRRSPFTPTAAPPESEPTVQQEPLPPPVPPEPEEWAAPPIATTRLPPSAPTEETTDPNAQQLADEGPVEIADDEVLEADELVEHIEAIEDADEVHEIHEVHEVVAADDLVEAVEPEPEPLPSPPVLPRVPTPVPARPKVPTPAPLRVRPPEPAQEPEPVAIEAEAELAPPPSLPVGAIDPWLAQAAFGYCPPETTVFHRPPPPTTFPGREMPGQEAVDRTPKP